MQDRVKERLSCELPVLLPVLPSYHDIFTQAIDQLKFKIYSLDLVKYLDSIDFRSNSISGLVDISLDRLELELFDPLFHIIASGCYDPSLFSHVCKVTSPPHSGQVIPIFGIFIIAIVCSGLIF